MCNTLRRPSENSGIIILKLKPKLKYQGHQFCEPVRPEFVNSALQYLKTHNIHHQDISINIHQIDKNLINFDLPTPQTSETNNTKTQTCSSALPVTACEPSATPFANKDHIDYSYNCLDDAHAKMVCR